MGEQESNFYEFGRFRLDAAERVLLRDRDLVPLTPKVFDILLALVERGGHLVEKDDLMKRVWPDTFVEEGNLTQSVSLLRKALGENPGSPQFIETVARRGYRFVAEVTAGTEDSKSTQTALQRVEPTVITPELVDAPGSGSLNTAVESAANGYNAGPVVPASAGTSRKPV